MTNEFSFIYDDGGRARYFSTRTHNDNLPRAIAIASGRDYREVYDALCAFTGDSPRRGIAKTPLKNFMRCNGFVWRGVQRFGMCKSVLLTPANIPTQGRIICKAARDYFAIIDGVIRDTEDFTQHTPPPAIFGYWEFVGNDDKMPQVAR